MNNPAENFTESQSSVGGEPIQPEANFQHRAKGTWENLQDQTGQTMQGSIAYVRENPVPVLIGALCLGLTLGLLSGRREPTFRERYIEEPLHDSRGMLLGAMLALGALFRNFFKSASSKTSRFAQEMGDVDFKSSIDPLSKAARNAGKKAGWH